MEVNYGELPEGCIAHMTSLTCPRDACRLSVVSTVFKAAAESDAVWERFFPDGFQSIIARSSSVDVENLPLPSNKKKDLFLYFANNHILIDGAKLSFWLDKWSGKKCYMLSAANMGIVWGDTPQYWKWVSHPKSRFSEVAELHSVCWLEMTGKFSTSLLSPSTNYAAFFVFNTAPDLYGFHIPVNTKVGLFGSDNPCKRTVRLEGHREERKITKPVRRRYNFAPRLPTATATSTSTASDTAAVHKRREDGWFEVELGDFHYVGDGSDDGELEVRLFETEHGHWKHGLVVEGIEIRPKRRVFVLLCQNRTHSIWKTVSLLLREIQLSTAYSNRACRWHIKSTEYINYREDNISWKAVSFRGSDRDIKSEVIEEYAVLPAPKLMIIVFPKKQMIVLVENLEAEKPV
ncbi:hypothetical protein ACFE04_028363 [Oxalis oulophora]